MRKLILISSFAFMFVCMMSLKKGTDDFLLASIQQASGGAVYLGANAADPADEQNSTANIANVSGHSISVESTTVHDGTWAIRIERTSAGGTNQVVELDMLGVLDTQTVEISIFTNELVGNAFQMRTTTSDGWTAQTATGFTGTGYQEHTIQGTATKDAPELEIRSLTGANQNDVLLIDKIVVTIIP